MSTPEFTPAEQDRLADGDTTDEIACYVGFPEIQKQIILDDRTTAALGEIATEATPLTHDV